MTNDQTAQSSAPDSRLLTELEEAEVFAQQLRERIVAIRDELAAGHAARALSMCNEALREIDNATDVVAPTPAAETRPAPPPR